MKAGEWFDTMTAVRVGTEDALRDRRAASSSVETSMSDTLERTRDCLRKSLDREDCLKARVQELEAELAAAKKELAALKGNPADAIKPR